MSEPLFSVAVQVPEHPKVVFFANRRPPLSGEVPVVEVTQRVARLVIIPAPRDEGAHFLQRLDAAGELVWQTCRPSLQETFWYAEWEYGVAEAGWTRADTVTPPVPG